MPMDEYREANLANWNDRVPVHAASGTYDLDRFVAGRDEISTIVEFDRRYVGDVSGKRLLHLQCHIGTDPQRWDDEHTYTDNGEAAIEHAVTYEWNHGIGEILTAVLDAGLEIQCFEEHRELEWQAWPLFEEDPETGRYRLPEDLRDRVPCMYTLVAEKPAT